MNNTNILFDCLQRCNPKDCAIVLTDNKNVLDFKNYDQIIILTNELITKFSLFSKSALECIGLLMQQNVYLPAIMISLQKLNQAFTFIEINSLQESIDSLHINWIISLELVDIKGTEEITRIAVDKEKHIIVWKRLEHKKPLNMENIFTVVQTSGTTGKKKIIRVPYSCIESNILCLSKIFGMTAKDVIFWGTPLTFDPSLIECLLSIFNGACLTIVPYKTYLNPHNIYKAIFSINPVTFLQMVPSVFLRWDDNYQRDILNCDSLRVLSFGGETFPFSVLQYERKESLKLFNLYGISEVSCWATCHEIMDTIENDIPIGRCLEDTLLELRGSNGENIQQGEGEIYIGSHSRICFVDDERADEIQIPHFRATGDIAVINEDGIYYKTRKNQLIKRFGHRVDLSKVEETIFKESGLKNKCIFSTKLQKLLSFIIMPENFNKIFCERTVDKLRVKLIHILPEASYPDHFEILRKLPLTCHGKVDRNILEEFYLKSVSAKYNLNSEYLFSDLWCKYLGLNVETLERVKHCTFPELGGTSIAALQLTTEIKDVLKSRCPSDILSQIFEKSFDECRILLKNYKKRIRNDNVQEQEHIAKKLVLENNFSVVWSYNLKACVDSTPLVFEKNKEIFIAIGGFSGIFVVLNSYGQEVYKHIFSDSIQSTPLVSKCGDFIFTGCFNGSMYSIDYLRNTVAWEFCTGGPLISPPCFCKNESAIIFGSYDKHVYCLTTEQGHLLWKTSVDGSISARPLINDKKIFIFSTQGSCFGLEEDNGQIIFKHPLGEPIFGTPYLLNSNEIIIPTVKNLVCISVENINSLWKFSVPQSIYSSLIAYKEYIIFGCHDQYIYIVKPLSKGCSLIGKMEIDTKTSSTVFIYERLEKVFIVAASNSGTIYVIDFHNLSVISTFKLPGETFSSPMISNGKIFIGCRDNNLYCIELSL